MKDWSCLDQVYRHSLSRHSDLVRAVAVLTQFAIDDGETLFETNYINS